jgi:hypothetical protein
VVATAEGTSRRVPAGACSIGAHSAAWRCYTVRWSEGTIERTGEVSAEVLSAYLLSCVVQYS